MDKTLTAERKLGTFMGAFLPCILSFLSTVYFLRLSWLVETNGILLTLLSISLTTLIVLISALSISSAATNSKIGPGGIYFILSRTFGIEAGSAIGIPLMIAQSINVAFCLTGFVQALHLFLPPVNPLYLAFPALFLLACAASLSTKGALKIQMVISILIALTLIFFFGWCSAPPTLSAATIDGTQFWVAFGIFFPAMTGVEVALALAPDLKNPTASVPRGMIAAIVAGFSLFCLSVLLLKITPKNPLVLITIAGATLSCALSSLISSSRMVESLSKERVLPKWLKGKSAFVAVSILSAGALLIGDLNKIAILLSLFFLIAYGTLNFALAVHSFLKNPSFRPSFKTHWLLSFIGSLLCLIAALMISPGNTLIALFVIMLLYTILKRRNIGGNIQDMRQSILLFLSRFALYRLSTLPSNAQSWRPNLLVFISSPTEHPHLISLSNAFTHKKGLLTMASVVSEKKEQITASLSTYFSKMEIPALIEVRQSVEALSEMSEMIKTYGLGPLTPNTIVLGATQKQDKFTLLANLIKDSQQRKKNIVLIRENGLQNRLDVKARLHYRKVIDVWWGGLSRKNSELMLILAHMLQSSIEWQNTTINLKTVISEGEDAETIRLQMEEFAKKSRLDIQPRLVKKAEGLDLFQNIILQSSAESDLVFLGLRAPLANESAASYADYYAALMKKTDSFPTIAYVLANEDVAFDVILN